jgi:hypothetical protein
MMIVKKILLIVILCFVGTSLFAQSSFEKKLERVEYLNTLRTKYSLSDERDSVFNLFFVAVDNMIGHPGFSLNNFQNKGLDTFQYLQKDEAFSFNLGGVAIFFSTDSSFATVSWSEMGGGCMHSSSGYFVFDSKGKKVKRFFGNYEYAQRFIYDIHTIDVDSSRYYFIEGGSATCGSKKFMQFDVHTWENDSLVMVDSSEIWVWCNRSQSFDYEYFKYGKRFYINNFEMDEDIGFFTDKVQRVKYIWDENKFILKTED